MKRTKSGRAWMHEHVTDVWVQRARREGWRSRAAFKLMEIDERDHLLRPGQVIVDLGAAPGSWSQVAVARTAPDGRVFALDLLAMEPIPGVHFIQGDFREDAPLRQLQDALAGAQVDVVLSDMAPNISGVAVADQARAAYLAELAVDFAVQHLAPQGRLLVKVFQGGDFPALRAHFTAHFAQVEIRKPKASRERSPEVYLLATGVKTQR
ncbi:MAG: RlmE family RNA methyltransferase [Rhodocyclaceae bacterium]|nr:RlmE family RNA methyltransferase [Rhodocyclaceae bacterium]